MDYSKLLDDIRQRTPRALCITSLFGDENSRVRIEGRSLSYEAVNLFVDLLGKSELIDSATLIGTEKDESLAGFISYSVACSLTKREGT